MPHRISYALRALRSRNLRLFYSGQGISLIGTQMQFVAMSWLVYRLTGSTVILGTIAMATQLPSIVMAPLAGALADRWSRYKLVVLAQVLLMVQAVVVAVLVLSGVVQVWHLVVLSFLLGVFSGMDIPARQALLVRLVATPDDLPNAIALNSSMFHSTRMVGPALGGVLIGVLGEGFVFAINAVSFVAVLWALKAMEPAEAARPPVGSMLRSLQQGLAYAASNPPIRGALLLLAGIATVGVPYIVLLPVFADDVLGGGAGTLGLLTSCSGLGALVAALWLASRSTVLGLGSVLVRATAIFGTGMILLAFSTELWLSGVILVVIGFGILTTTAGINTVLQTLVEEDKRGRVMSLYTVAFVGAGAAGSFLGGALASRLGAPWTVAIGGGASILMALWFWSRLPALRRTVHPVYREMGILPELATGVNTASELRPKV